MMNGHNTFFKLCGNMDLEYPATNQVYAHFDTPIYSLQIIRKFGANANKGFYEILFLKFKFSMT